MKALLKSFLAVGLVLTLAAACQKDIPVTEINISPAAETLYVGETLDLTVQCLPEDATNIDELMVYSTSESIASYENGKVIAKQGGTVAITASCGNVLAQSRIKVYRDKILKGGATYGIDFASGYRYKMGTDTVFDIEINLIHNEPDGTTQNFQTWLKAEQLGMDLDFTKPLDGAFAGVFANNNEDGFLVFSSLDDSPMVRTADWGSDGATLVRGILRVDHLGFNQFKIHADFALSNGYTFGTDWEGNANMVDS